MNSATWLEVLGWTGSAVLVWSLLQSRILRLRVINLVGCVLLIAYNAIVGVLPMIGLNVVLAIINIVYLRKLLATRHDERSYEILEVAPDEVAPLLAFLVLRGTETVGLVALRPAPGGVGIVELDYVTERYRDFTPGEFVFRDGNTLTAQGFRHIEVPAAMAAPYYERIGFTRRGTGFALDLAS